MRPCLLDTTVRHLHVSYISASQYPLRIYADLTPGVSDTAFRRFAGG